MKAVDITGILIDLVQKTIYADESKLKSLRTILIGIADKIGAKNFVTLIAEILKKDFCIEGCNDLRVPLKRIFTISLEELEEDLSKKKYTLPEGHPIYILSEDHKDNIGRLKALSLSFAEIKKDCPYEKIIDRYNKINGYYKELDSHIRKEEEVLFPVLEENGMKEHPDSLRNEHKEFREILTEICEAVKEAMSKRQVLGADKIASFREKFIPSITNHIFRETHIFYPASLEFITEADQWGKIKKGFELLK